MMNASDPLLSTITTGEHTMFFVRCAGVQQSDLEHLLRGPGISPTTISLRAREVDRGRVGLGCGHATDESDDCESRL